MKDEMDIRPIAHFDPPLSSQLADWIDNLTYQAIPSDVIEKAKEFVLDMMGCALGAVHEEPARIGREIAIELGGKPEATILGSSARVAAANAAFSNGITAHTLDYDDDHREGTMHPSVSIIPCALALSEKEHRTGREFLTAAVCGYESMIRSGSAFLGKAYYAGWHNTATCGVFGATASASKLLGLTPKQIAHAFGLALSFASGTNEYADNGAWAKRLHPGHAAKSGVIAAMLAGKGFTGPRLPFEGPFGLFKVYRFQDYIDPERLTRGLGDQYEISTNSIKFHMGGRFGATSADAMLEIVQNNEIDPEQVEKITLGACDFTILAHVGKDDSSKQPKYRPETHEQALFSLPYTLACILLFKRIGPDQYREDLYGDSRIVKLMDKVEAVVDPVAESKYPKHYMARVEVKEKSGKLYEATVEYPKGDPENPVTREELLEKFLALSTKAISQARAESLAESLLNLEKVADMNQLAGLLGAGG